MSDNLQTAAQAPAPPVAAGPLATATRPLFSVGFRTLFTKETRRFLRVPGQTLAAPVMTTLLYFLVFGYSLGDRLKEVHGVPYVRYIVPGLVMMPLLQNAFLNTSSSLFIMKMQGTIVDLLVAPLAYGEILAAFVGAAVLRSLIVGALVYVVAGLFTGFGLAHPGFVVGFALLTSTAFALAGMCVAIVSDKFEQLNIIPTFIITPLTFLGGVFYSIEFLPPAWKIVARCNPVLYMVEGLRYGFIGTSDVNPWIGGSLLAAMCLVGAVAAWRLLVTGYKLRG